MKILVVSQRYWPENFRITDICEELVKRGHNVTVLTGLPNYPQGFLYDGYEKGQNRIQNHNHVKIIRAKEVERRHDIIHRFLNYYSFPMYAKRIVKRLDKNFDVVLMNELSPIMAAYPAIKYKKMHKAKILMYEMDLWPESLLAGGIKKSSILYKHYKKVSAKIYSKMDTILVSTKEHIDYICRLPDCQNLMIKCLPQYAETIFVNNNRTQIEKATFDFMFAGNIGKAQNLDILIDAANILREDKEIMFHIVGDGSDKKRLEEKAKKLELNNITFYGFKTKEEMPLFYDKADVMLVTLVDDSYASMTIPGKVQSYMAYGKPILSAANGATNNLIVEAKCGQIVNDNNAVTFAKKCLFLKTCDCLDTYSSNALQYYKKTFEKDTFFEKLISELKIISKNK